MDIVHHTDDGALSAAVLHRFADGLVERPAQLLDGFAIQDKRRCVICGVLAGETAAGNQINLVGLEKIIIDFHHSQPKI